MVRYPSARPGGSSPCSRSAAGSSSPIEHLVDALWEDHPPDRADRNVAALISRLRRALGRELIEGSAAGYRIRADRVTVDLHDAADLVATAELELGQRRYALASTSGELAAKLLDADIPMAGEHEDRWVRELRSATSDLLHRARTAWSRRRGGAGRLRHRRAGRRGRAARRPVRRGRLPHGHARPPAGRPARQRAARLPVAARGAGRAPGHRSLPGHPGPAPGRAARREHDDRHRRAGRRRPARHRTIVGRDAELGRLRELWTAAAAGRPTLPSSSARRASARVRWSARSSPRPAGPARSSSGPPASRPSARSTSSRSSTSCARSLTAPPPAEVRELAGSRLGTLVELVPELADLVGPIPYERGRRPRSSTGAASTPSAASSPGSGRSGPVLLVVEDMQHAGQSTVEALHVLAGHWRAAAARCCVLTERTDEDPVVADGCATSPTLIDAGPAHAGATSRRWSNAPVSATTRNGCGPGRAARRCS